MVLNGSRAEFTFPEQIGLVAAQMIRTELVRRLVEVFGEPLDEACVDNAALCRQSSCDARAPRASFCEDESQWLTSCDSHAIPATKLLDSQSGSDRGACGFVLTRHSSLTHFLALPGAPA
jgi:hypothetical protein